MSRTGDETPTVEGAFIRIRALGHAVAYAGVRVQEGTTAAETIELVAKKLRMSEDERLSKRLVCAYPVERRSAPAAAARRAAAAAARDVVWRVRTLLRADSVLAARRKALLAAAGFDVDDDVRFYLRRGRAAVGLRAAARRRPWGPARPTTSRRRPWPSSTGAGSRTTRRPWVPSETVVARPELWRRRTCVVCRDRLWFWRAELAPDPALVVPDEGEAPEVAWGRALDAEACERNTCAHVDRRAATSPSPLPPAGRRADVATRHVDVPPPTRSARSGGVATAASARRARALGRRRRAEEEPPAGARLVRAAVHRVRVERDVLTTRGFFVGAICKRSPRHHARWRQGPPSWPGGTTSPGRRVSTRGFWAQWDRLVLGACSLRHHVVRRPGDPPEPLGSRG